jgi:uncharacterized protein Yka (UPF0111/DUF47 family)
MMQKARIAGVLGERGLLMPTLINAALAANDRTKYLFTLLQAAVGRARQPERPVPDLRRERIACQIDEESLDAVIGAARVDPDGRIRIPGAEAIVHRICAEVATMLAPFADSAGSPFRERFEALRTESEALHGDLIAATDVDALTAVTRGSRDTMHRLVMDLHKALNAAQARIASEVIDGASVYGVEADDRPLVAAFMRGLRRTAPLKFDHPGLGTTATRSGKTLLIQNDLGTTDAHVLIVHVEGARATLKYSDVHLPRLLFFQKLFEPWAVEWSDTFSRRDDQVEDGVFHLCEGAFAAAGRAQMEEYLAFLGSRLVFLVDWNKARKRLRALVSKDEAGRLLGWAARNDFGHMGFLKAGGELLVYDALDFVIKGGARFGQKLDDILGKREATDYLRFVLKTCSEAFRRGEPESFVQDAVRAELFNNFRTLQEQLYDIVADHAALTVEIAGGVRDGLLQLRVPNGAVALARAALRAKDWESRADDLVNRARGATGRSDPANFFRTIVESADQVADELEEAAFNLTLLPAGPGGPAGDTRLQALAELLVQGAQEYVKVVESARHVRRGGLREDTQDFLAAAHRIQEIEHGADSAQRAIRAELLARIEDPRVLHVLLGVTRNLEGAADALMHCGMRMREHVLADVLAK